MVQYPFSIRQPLYIDTTAAFYSKSRDKVRFIATEEGRN